MNPTQEHDQELIRRATPEGMRQTIAELRKEVAQLRAKVAAMQLVIDGRHHGDAEKFCAGVNAALDLEAAQGRE